MQISFANRSVVVTGASRGIGFAIALGFARAGARVGICARGEDGLAAAATEIGRCGTSVFSASCDLADEHAAKRFVGNAGASLGGIDVLINNASGMSQGDGEAAWHSAIGVDVLGTVRVTRTALPFLERSVRGAIINIASIRGITGSNRLPSYAAAKAAVISYTISQSVELSRRGIRVNAVAPGSIEFPGGTWEKRRHTDPAGYESTRSRIPAGRLGTAQEVANVVLFLASDLATWVTGQVIVVDGGQMRT
jgi:3-oxoacyl-[acyl-carrier protein] reductase